MDARALDRFFDKIEVDWDTCCWVWTASVFKGDYGRFSLGGRSRVAHVVAYEHFVGPVPAGRQLDHLCRVRRCVNPGHLEAVTCQVNLLRGETAAARLSAVTHCPQGHEYTAENTYLSPRDGCRTCVLCRNIRRREYHKAHREERLEAQRVRYRSKQSLKGR